MVYISLQHLQPFGQHIGQRLDLSNGKPHVGEFPEGEKAQTVGVVEITGIKDLFVQTRPVKAHIHSQMNVLFQRRIIGGGVDALPIKALVQYGAQEKGLAVQREDIVLEAHLADAEIGGNGIGNRAIFAKC